MTDCLEGCVFCNIVNKELNLHLKNGENCVVIKDQSPHAPHHFLVLSKKHISRPSDLTVEHIPLVKEMEEAGRECLRKALKGNGDADTVEAMLRIGFHRPPFLTVNHLHMHVLYPVQEMKFFYKNIVYRPGHFFRLSKTIIEELEKIKNRDGSTDLEKKMEGNPAIGDPKDPVEPKIQAAAVAN
uniref:Adenosine 5'-monophosphoramidase HINT3 n=1 Tax=Syphacia muris TaxID=451379 RepID=A0A0N5APX4_9BILA